MRPKAEPPASHFGLPDEAVEKIQHTLAGFPAIESALIFGSRSLGTHRASSDIDLALIAPTLNTETLMQLADRLDDLMLPWMFDLVLLHAIQNPDLIGHIQRVGQTFYSRVS